jgi:hypothetical protein
VVNWVLFWPTGLLVSPTLPRYHWKVNGLVPLTVTLRFAVAPGPMFWLCGWSVIEGTLHSAGCTTMVWLFALPQALVTRTQNELLAVMGGVVYDALLVPTGVEVSPLAPLYHW